MRGIPSEPGHYAFLQNGWQYARNETTKYYKLNKMNLDLCAVAKDLCLEVSKYYFPNPVTDLNKDWCLRVIERCGDGSLYEQTGALAINKPTNSLDFIISE